MERGTNAEYLQELTTYWRDGFRWRQREDALNRFPQFTTEIARDLMAQPPGTALLARFGGARWIVLGTPHGATILGLLASVRPQGDSRVHTKRSPHRHRARSHAGTEHRRRMRDEENDGRQRESGFRTRELGVRCQRRHDHRGAGEDAEADERDRAAKPLATSRRRGAIVIGSPPRTCTIM